MAESENNPNDSSDDRRFLHDIASPIGAAIFLTDAMLDEFQSRPGANSDDIIQLGQILQSLERVKKCLEERRDVLIKRGGPSART